MTNTATLASELDTPESAALTAAHAGRQRTRTVAGVVLTRESFDAWSHAGWSFRFDGGDWWALPPVGRESERELFGSLRAAVLYARRRDVGALIGAPPDIRTEGGLADHPADRGGATSAGFTGRIEYSLDGPITNEPQEGAMAVRFKRTLTDGSHVWDVELDVWVDGQPRCLRLACLGETDAAALEAALDGVCDALMLDGTTRQELQS